MIHDYEWLYDCGALSQPIHEPGESKVNLNKQK